jgi:hypothetical protein
MRRAWPFIVMLSLAVFGCAEGDEPGDENYDPFATGPGAADTSGDRPYRLVPESGAFDLLPNDELLEERLYYQPYTVDGDGNNIHVYRPDDAWYQIRRYVMTVETAGHLEVTTEAQSALLVDIWRVVSDGNERVDNGIDYAEFDIVEPGRYGVLVSPSVFPVRSVEEEAYVDYVLRTTFTPAN